MKLDGVLAKYFYKKYNIDVNSDYILEKVDAKELFVANRIDLIAKFKYIEYREKGYDLTYIKELYAAHIEAFSLGTFTEAGNSNKNSINKYFNTFNELIDSIKEKGLDENVSVIPVGRDNAIMDGAHRTAIAAYFSFKVPIIRFHELSANYNADFFRERLLDENYIDYLVTEYCKNKDNVYFACIWPVAKGDLQRKQMLNVISKSCKVVYGKRINLNYEGLHNLIAQVYASQEWCGSVENHFWGAKSKTDACYDEDGFVTIYILECNSLDKIKKIKNQVRDIFGMSNHSIHITDNQSETIKMANLLLNKNSIDYLNRGKPFFYVEFNKKLQNFKQQLISNNFSLDEFIIDSSSVMGLYGLRNISDIDFLTVSKGYEIVENSNSHHKYIDCYEMKIDNLIFNPNNYLVYNDLKFISLEILRKFKMKRHESKDKIDIQLIDSILEDTSSLKVFMLRAEIWLKRKKRNFAYLCRVNVINMLTKIGIYKNVRKVYRSIRGEKTYL